jgi:D-sedoheptulose 7-phosphate isomerase
MNPKQWPSLLEAKDVLDRFLADAHALEQMEVAARLMTACLKSGGTLISCGNGGSMADAMHFAEELSGRFRQHRSPMRAISISDPTYLTCVANDYGYDAVFSRFVEGHGKRGDVLLAISTSGNSTNVVQAAEMAHKMGMHVVGLTGKTGGLLAPLCHAEVRAPQTPFADRVQEIHIKVIHAWIEYLEDKLG